MQGEHRVEREERLTDAELHALLDRMFPQGFAGADVLAELAPGGWERSPLVACFHPPAERVFEEALFMHRRLEELAAIGRRRVASGASPRMPEPEPTLESVRASHQATPVHAAEELEELVGLCLWDVCSDNHDVIAADGRLADFGSFRGTGAFLDEHVTRDRNDWREGDYLRFYMGTIFISGRADLAPVYGMIFRRLKAVGGDWVYHFPELLLVELGSAHDHDEVDSRAPYSPNEALATERRAREQERRVEKLRTDLAESNARAREEALDAPPPAIVRAYREVYGRDPSGWPPA